jgi:hypothetical protein
METTQMRIRKGYLFKLAKTRVSATSHVLGRVGQLNSRKREAQMCPDWRLLLWGSCG